MKKSTLVINIFIVLVLTLTTFGASAQAPLPADVEEDVDLLATDASMPKPTDVFPGLSRNLYPVIPAQNNDTWAAGSVPDVSGAPGTYWYVQAVNDEIAVYQKDGTNVYTNTLNGLWAAFGNTGTLCDGAANRGQPNVLFDEGSGRFVIADVAYNDIDNGPYYICIITSDEEGVATNSYSLNPNTGIPNYYPDSVKLGLWQDSYYISANMIDIDNNGTVRTPHGAKVWALKAADMTTCKDLNFDGYCEFDFMSHYLSEVLNYHFLVPSTYSGLAPAADTPNYFAAIKPGKFYIWEFDVDWNSFISSFGNNLSPNYTINTDTSAIWATGSIIPQWDVSEMVDAHGERLGTPMQYRIVDGVPGLWVTHTVESNPGPGTGQRWYEIRFDEQGSPLFFQTGTHTPDNDYRWNGSLAVDGAGNMALGYNTSTDESNPALAFYPEIRYAGRLKTDLNGTLPQTEVLFEEGGFPVYDGSQYDTDGVPDGPWGRQSHMSVDPLDDCIFWYTNMFYDQNSNGEQWHTAIGWFSFPQCGAGQTKRVSLSTQDAQGNGTSGLDFEMYSVGISASGRYVAFSSEASTLVSGDNAGHRDVFLRDRDYDEDGLYDEPGEVLTTRISKGWDGSEANDDSWEVSVSGYGLYDLNNNGSLADETEIDGRYITFSSDADNLVQPNGSPDSNHARDVFVYDRITGETIRASVKDQTAKDVGNNTSDQPFISKTGDFVVFRSKSTNLVPSDINGSIADIYIRDLLNDRTYMVSLDIGGNQSIFESATPTITDDGQYVAFASRGNLAPGDGNGPGWDVFVRDLVTPNTLRVSVGNGDSYTPYIAGGGQYVVFASRSNNLPIPPPADTNGYADIFVHDLTAVTTERVSLNFYGGQALNGHSYSPSITSDGRYISFASEANNLDVHLPDTNNLRDIYLHDRTIGLTLPFATFGLTKRVSMDYMGGQANGGSFAPVIAPNGRHIAYVSAATDLVNNDTNNAWDVFAYDSHRVIPTFLTIPTNVTGGVGDIVSVPVNFMNGYAIDSTVFSIDFDELCLSFNPAMANAVTFSLPADFIKTWTYDASDTDGEIDISIYDHIAPRTVIPDGTIVRIKFTIKSACLPAPGSVNNARVGFSSFPAASFGSNGQSIMGYASDGFVRILPGKLGDCNGDNTVDAGDLSALVLEFFDGDGVLPADTPMGTFAGNPIGCNPNQDMVVDAGDLSCTVLIIWGGGSAACTGMLSATSQLAGSVEKVSLTVPTNFLAVPSRQISLPIQLDPKGKQLSSAVFSIDFNQSWLSFDDSDGNSDGIPDAVNLNLPSGYVAAVNYDAQDTDGELDVVVYYPGVATTTLPAGTLLTVQLSAGVPQSNFVAEVKSSQDPSASFGSVTGTSVPGIMFDGSVWILTNGSQFFIPVTAR